MEQLRAQPALAAVAAVCAVRVGRADSGRGQYVDIALYGCMISIHDDAVPGCTPSGGISLALRYLDCGASPRSPAPLPGQHSRGVAAGLGYLDAEVDALVRMHMLHVEAAAR